MNKILNLKYAAIQATYWMIYCIFLGYASVFLLDKSYTNSSIGYLMAIGFFSSIILQQLVAGFIDSASKINVVDACFFASILLLGFAIILHFLPHKGFLLSIFFIIVTLMIMLLQPLLNSLSFHFTSYGHYINFGVARSMGSLFYAIISAILGIIIVHSTPTIITSYGLVFCLLIFLLLSGIWLDDKKLIKASDLLASTDNSETNDVAQNTIEAASDNNTFTDSAVKQKTLSNFFFQYRLFFLFLLGGLGLFFGHTTINNFFFQIISSVGGTSADLGTIQAYSAICELPAMIFFDKIHKRIGCKKLLRISAYFFLIKVILTLFATSVPLFYLSMTCQMFAFAIFIPASVHYVDEIMDKSDAVKGQAFVTGMITLANLISSVLGGFIIDHLGTHALLVIAMIVTALGSLLTVLTLLSKNDHAST